MDEVNFFTLADTYRVLGGPLRHCGPVGERGTPYREDGIKRRATIPTKAAVRMVCPILKEGVDMNPATDFQTLYWQRTPFTRNTVGLVLLPL